MRYKYFLRRMRNTKARTLKDYLVRAKITNKDTKESKSA